MKLALASLAFLFLSASALAERVVYRDEKGKWHVVGSEAEVPEKYRAGSKRLRDAPAPSGRDPEETKLRDEIFARKRACEKTHKASLEGKWKDQDARQRAREELDRCLKQAVTDARTR